MLIKGAGRSFITTPIFYVNGSPHLGHLYSAVLADAYHRFIKLTNPGQHHIFSTGTDEHGLKVEQAAAAAAASTASSSTKVNVKLYCDNISNQFKQLVTNFNISNTDYIRTTDPRHLETVNSFWRRLEDKGMIYKSNYEGWYSITDETFVPSSQVTEIVKTGGVTLKINSESGHPVQWTSEENYMFRLSQIKDYIKYWAQKDDVIQPKQFLSPVLKWLESIQDLSISRPDNRLSWGIPVPTDSSQVIYVWLDALVNYLTVAGYPLEQFNSNWPPTVHVVGKDILKFHAIYWPAFLIGAGLEPPHKILCHSHWTVDNVKMSKSLGNMVDPFSLAKSYGVEAVRYFLLREGVPHSDGNFNEEKLVQMVNVDLADTLGNLLSRSSSKALNPAQIWPKYNEEQFNTISSRNAQTLKESLLSLPDKVGASYQEFNFYRGLEHIMATLRIANAFVQEEQPWKLVKLSPNEPALLALICLVLETLRVIGIMLQPIVPTLSSNLLDKLNVPTNERLWNHIEPFCWEENMKSLNSKQHKSLENQSLILFSRIKS